MRTLLLVHILLSAFASLLGSAPLGTESAGYQLAGYYQDFDSWVNHIQTTCHPDPDEDDEDDDHLPSRPQNYKDEVFSKWVKEKKKLSSYNNKKAGGKYTKKVKSYGKKYVPGRQLVDEDARAITTPAVAKKEKKPRKGNKKDKKGSKKPKSDKKSKKPKQKKPKKPIVEGPTAPMTNTSSGSAPPPPVDSAPAPFDSPVPSPLSSPIPVIQKKIISVPDDDVIVVAKDGSGDFATVQAAIDSVPKNNNKRVIIFVKKGIYREKVLIPSSKPFITLKGENQALTYIQWGDTASTIGRDGKPLGTYGSASVAIESDDFIALDISFKNTAPQPPNGAVGKQAVALRIQGDRAAFYRCSFYGAQDTLYDREGRHYYFKCYIEGSVDFIFGNARSLFVKCHIHSIAAPFGSITAHKRMGAKENTGYSFAYCIVTGTGTIYLGRSWGAFSRVVYSFTYFDDIIVPQGWNDWNIPSNQKSVYYGEYRCYGPGANTAGRVKWSKQLTPEQAKPFLSLAFIDGKQWLPK